MKRHLLPLFYALISMALFLPGCAHFSFSREQTVEQQRTQQRYDDAAIKTEISSALLRRSPARANTVSVRSFNGHVFLIGAADEQFRNEATDIARSAEGVAQVTTHWFPAGTTLGSADAVIESNIESDVLRMDPVLAQSVAVDVWGGHVVLTGFVDDKSQIDTAVTKIREMTRIRSVTSYVVLY